MKRWTFLALCIGASAAEAVTNPVALLRTALQECQARQASQAPHIGTLPNGNGYLKTQELGAQYGLDVSPATAPDEATIAVVEIATSLVSVSAATREAVEQLPLSVTGPQVTTMARRYRFEWTGARWTLGEAYINLGIRMPGMHSLPMRDKKVETGSARSGFDAGASCVQAIEALSLLPSDS